MSTAVSETKSPEKPNTGVFSQYADVGNPKLKGSITYDTLKQTYTLEGAGYNVWNKRDEFFYLFNELEGDFLLTAQFKFTGTGGQKHKKFGWMVRASLEEDSLAYCGSLHGDGLVAAQWRESKGAVMIGEPFEEYGADILQVERLGTTYTFRVATFGEPFKQVATKDFEALSGKVMAGLFVCSRDVNVLESAQVWNVRIERHVPDDYNFKENGVLGSRLEIMDVFTGKRRLIHESPTRFEAPNWMPDGKHILFNMKGLLYTVPLDGGKPTVLDTGDAKRNNNDHGISFDGKLLAISNNSGSGSRVYVLPITGGTPKLVTEKAPSYWHGWSPDNKEVLYVAKRKKQTVFNIFSANIDTLEEKQLTTFETGHVDGPEYDPQGKWIYFNASQSGAMQIWRMTPDGSNHQQLTFDEFYDWFPHVSPDGKWIVFLSYLNNIEVNSHPLYKRVILRKMSLENLDEKPKTIAYLFGGQGTINVPSWSPDSRYISFVSNTR